MKLQNPRLYPIFNQQPKTKIEPAFIQYYLIPVTIIAGSSQPIRIYTDKHSYSAGDTMHLGLDVYNPVDRPITVCVAIWCKRPVGPIKLILHALKRTIPPGFAYGFPNFRSFVLPSIPPGVYTWHAAIFNPATHRILIEDTAEWELT